MLVNLPWFEDGQWGVRAGSRWPHLKNEIERDYLPFPFHMAYAAAMLEEEGFSVRIVDAVAQELLPDALYQEVEAFQPDVLAAEISYPSRIHDLNLLKQIKPGIRIIICGPDHEATHDPLFLKQHSFITAAIAGEYEWTLVQLMLCWKKNLPYGHLAGLVYRKDDQVLCCSGQRQLMDVNRFPWPHRKTLPMRKYMDAPGGLPLPSVQMWASRGCPFTCTFCVWPSSMSKPGCYRPRHIEDVLNEMHYLVHHLKFRSVYFDDDTFNVGQKRMETFCKRLIERRKKGEILVPWGMMARADLMSEPLLDLFKEAGLHSVKYGVESADQTILDNIRKKMDLEKTVSLIRYTQKIGIKTHLTFMFGLPGETSQTIQKTIDLALSLNPDSLQFSEAVYFPGTLLYEQLRTGVFSPASELSPENIKTAREEAYIRWGEHCLLRRTPQKIKLSLWHWRRFRTFFQQYGLKAVALKTADYLKFWVQHNINIERHGYHTIFSGKSRLVVVGGTLRLFYRERELTHGPGFQSSFRLNGKRYDTSLCDVMVNRMRPDEFYIQFDFRTQGLPLKQIWWMRWESELQLAWRVDWISTEEKPVTELKFSCMLGQTYSRWKTPQESGDFPPIEDWHTVDLSRPSFSSVGVENHDHPLYPPLSLNYFSVPALFREQIQNTDRVLFARMIHAAALEKISIPSGRTSAFSGYVKLGESLNKMA